ncbi:MAG TPA: OmpA family protein [Thermoanaerobaculia bacterium]|nr:OmpA family protein [Thermoanaerobaculia bacterium]
MKQIYLRTVTATALTALLGACATSKSVDEKIAASQAASNQKIESVASQVEDLQSKNTATNARIDQTNQRVDELSQTAQDALKRAQDAGVLAKGQVVFEQAFTDENVKFKTGSTDLSKEAKTALDEFAGKVKALNEQYFIEIQGHTDDVGSTKYNDDLGQRRADSVRRYLGREQKLPLARMSTISYGDTAPVASNKNRKGRSQNRRVMIVVLE